jgi:hypothetical protein
MSDDRPPIGLLLADFEPARITTPPDAPASDVSRFCAIMPIATHVNVTTDTHLRGLEARGVRVDRMLGTSAVGLAGDNAVSREIINGTSDAVLFIDSDISFDPEDALRLLRRPEPVVSGLVPGKGHGKDGHLIADFGPGTAHVKYGPHADRLYPLVTTSAGFLRIKVDFLKRMIRESKLPFCNTSRGWCWPFFMPMVAQMPDGESRYLTEDAAFAYRCTSMGEPVLCDTSFRLGHIGDHAYQVEEGSGITLHRHENVEFEFVNPPRPPMPELPPDLADLVQP